MYNVNNLLHMDSNYYKQTQKNETIKNKSANNISPSSDNVNISKASYILQSDNLKFRATSGNDLLEITRDSVDKNDFTIHFSDSAMVNRTLKRGYIDVNGNRINLSDELKSKLQNVDRKAQVDRETAFKKYTMQHGAAVAKQQAEAYAEAFEKLTDRLLETYSKRKDQTPKLKFKTYETQLHISMNDGKININGVTEAEKDIK